MSVTVRSLMKRTSHITMTTEDAIQYYELCYIPSSPNNLSFDHNSEKFEKTKHLDANIIYLILCEIYAALQS